MLFFCSKLDFAPLFCGLAVQKGCIKASIDQYTVNSWQWVRHGRLPKDELVFEQPRVKVGARN